MNKYITLSICFLLIIFAAIYFLPQSPQKAAPLGTDKIREVTLTAKRNQWRFDPALIEVKKGDRVVATVFNEDDYDHGFAIDEFGISKRLSAKSKIIVEFVADKEGDFTFYCSVPCGEGLVDGKKRGHTYMMGTIRVKA